MTGNAAYFLGVDGGGSGCRAALSDSSGTIVASGTSGPGNATSDFDGAVANIGAAISEACQNHMPADLPTHIGLAGILSKAEAKRFALALGMSQARVTDDRPTTLAGALGGKDGLLAAIGTGSFVGASYGNETRFLGGWGLQLGDQASGAWLGKMAMQQVMLAHDKLTPPSDLTQWFLDHFNGPNGLVAFASSANPADFASFAPRIADAAEAGDKTATRVMEHGAGYLSKALETLDFDAKSPVCLTGGLGLRYAQWLPPQFAARIIAPRGSALDGALMLARQL